MPKFADHLPRSPNDAFAAVEDMWEFARKLNPALEDGDGDLEEHLRVHDFLVARRNERAPRDKSARSAGAEP